MNIFRDSDRQANRQTQRYTESVRQTVSVRLMLDFFYFQA